MRIEGQRTIQAGPRLIWMMLHDPRDLAELLPGSAAVEAGDNDEFQISLDLRVGRAVERFNGTLTIEPAAPFRRADFRAHGESPVGAVDARGQLTLEARGDGATELAYAVQIEPNEALPASSRMLKTTAQAFARRALDGLERQVSLRTRVYTTTVAPPVSHQPARPARHRPAIVWRVLAALLLLLSILYFRRARRAA